MSATMTALDFCTAARVIGTECRSRNLRPPSFRSPPRIVGEMRSIRRVNDAAIVSVAIRSRSKADVVADMIEGAIAANDLHDVPGSQQLRTEFWQAMTETGIVS